MRNTDSRIDPKVQKRIEKAEKRAAKLGVDEGLIQRFWDMVNMFPKVSSPELERRIENFILNAPPGHYFIMQQVMFREVTPMLLEDARIMEVMRALEGKKIGLAVSGEYESTVCIGDCCFEVRRGISEDIPVISVTSRRDYADAALNKIDPIKMILGRKIRATHKLKLMKWGWPHKELIRDSSLFERYLSYQDEIEHILDENLARLGY